MAFAPSKTYFDQDGTILGCFVEKDNGNLFEFSVNDENIEEFTEWPHKVWVCDPWKMDHGYRYARVLKTVVYILVDEGITEKWSIKQHREYIDAKAA